MNAVQKMKKVFSLDTDEAANQRQEWENSTQFILSCIAMCVGLGNVWRFPFTAYENGGGAFLIPYLIVLIFVGHPLFFLELGLGQFASRGSVKIWKVCPLFKGVGYASAFATTCVTSYYCVIMAVTALYFFASLKSELPWSSCNELLNNVTCKKHKAVVYDGQRANGTEMSFSQLYFSMDVLHQRDSLYGGIGLPDWQLTLCLALSWFIIFVSLFEGPKSVGKMAYFSASLPYAILIILLIRGMALPGAWKGIQLFFTPDWEKLLDPKVWYRAVVQCFLSLSVAFGPVTMCASYNPFRHNVYRSSIIISGVDAIVSLVAGCAVFAILGNLQYELSQDAGRSLDFNKIIKSGPELVFVAYPQAIAKFEYCPRLFAILLFLMLLTLGIASATYNAATIFTIIQDRYPKMPQLWISAVIAVAGFLLGLLYTTPEGLLLIDLVDKFGTEFIIFTVIVIEAMVVAWIYGVSNIVRDLEFMLKTKFSAYLKICWGLIAPLSLLTILVYNLYNFTPLDPSKYPPVAIVSGWILAITGLMLFPIAAIHTVINTDGVTWREKIANSLKPSDSWGPSCDEDRECWTTLPRSKPICSQLISRTCLRRETEAAKARDKALNVNGQAQKTAKVIIREDEPSSNFVELCG